MDASGKAVDWERSAIGWRLAKAGDEQDAANWAYDHLDALLVAGGELRAALNEALAQNERFNTRYRDSEAENERLRETIAEWQEIHGTFSGDVHAACQAEIERLRAERAADDIEIGKLRTAVLIRDMRVEGLRAAVEVAAAMVRHADPDLADVVVRRLEGQVASQRQDDHDQQDQTERRPAVVAPASRAAE